MNNKAISLLVVDDDIRICEQLQERLEDNETTELLQTKPRYNSKKYCCPFCFPQS